MTKWFGVFTPIPARFSDDDADNRLRAMHAYQ
jgi:hypothetical protein